MVTRRIGPLPARRPGQIDLLVPPGFDPERFYKLAKPVQTMLKRLSSARQRSPQSLNSYCIVAQNFFRVIGAVRTPTEEDWHDYFMIRRRQEVSERTLGKEFYILKKLAESNHWAWPFFKEDTPRSYDDTEEPAFTRDQVISLITSHPLLSRTEKFYLACSTIWGLRSIEMSRIEKRDYDDRTIKIKKSKREKSTPRLIPEELRPLFREAHPSLTEKASLSVMFARICRKAGIQRERRQSFHAIRRCLSDELEYVCTVNRIRKSYLGAFIGWADAKIGAEAGGAAMAGTYIKHNRPGQDPFEVDRTILRVHPFLQYWKGVRP